MKNRFFLKKAKKILFSVYHRYCKKKKELEPTKAEEIKKELLSLQSAILQNDALKAVELGHIVQNTAQKFLKKSIFEQVRDFIFGIGEADEKAGMLAQPKTILESTCV